MNKFLESGLGICNLFFGFSSSSTSYTPAIC